MLMSLHFNLINNHNIWALVTATAELFNYSLAKKYINLDTNWKILLYMVTESKPVRLDNTTFTEVRSKTSSSTAPKIQQ
jgi:hypothetical protein